jgi:hypothetical protein
MNRKLTLNDVLSHGPYSGKTVAYVLKNDPSELLEYNPENYLIPHYDVQPEILQEAYKLSQDQLSWDEFIALWNRTD